MQQSQRRQLPLIISLNKDVCGRYQYMGDNMNQITHQQQQRQSDPMNKRRENQKIQNYTQLTKYNENERQNNQQNNSGSLANKQSQDIGQQQHQTSNGQESRDVQSQNRDSHQARPEVLPYSSYNLQKIQDNQQNENPISILPSVSFWFDINKIHVIEKQAFPECFNKQEHQLSVKWQGMYLKYRNFIVQNYRNNPKQYLTATKCRKSLVGDVQLIIKLHSFLEHWGIINFNVNQQKMKYENVWEDQINRLPRKVVRLDQKKKMLDLKVNQLTTNLRPICDFCGQDCNLVWFNYNEPRNNPDTRQADSKNGDRDSENLQEQNLVDEQNIQLYQLILCTQCYHAEKYPAIFHKNHFIKYDLINDINNNEQNQGVRKPLSSQEQQKMLEVLSKYKDNWTEIEKQLGKSQQQILVDFIQVPFTNQNIKKLLEKYENNDDDQFNYPSQQIYEHELNVFQDQSNPIFLYAAIFQHLLNSRNTTTKYQNRLNELDENDQEVLLDIEQKTLHKAKLLKERELKKIKKIVKLLIEQQMNKLETKVRLFEAYEKTIDFEKSQLKLHQQTIINQRVQDKVGQYS